METIFITGGTGFIGKKLLVKLNEKYNLICLKRKNSNIDNLPSNIQWITGDISSYHLSNETIQKIDYVIHSAALVSFNENDNEEILRTNIKGTSNTIDQFIGSPSLKKFIHISSIASLGRKEEMDEEINEDSIWEDSYNNTTYAISKHKSELEVYRGMNENIPAIILNPSMILGKNTTGTYAMVKAIKKEIKYYPTGINGFVDIDDVVEVIIQSIQLGAEHNGERVTINGQNVSFKKVLDTIALNLDLKAPIKAISTRKGLFFAKINKLLASITNTTPIINKNTVIVGNSVSKYSNQKSKIIFKDFKYRTIEESIRKMCDR